MSAGEAGKAGGRLAEAQPLGVGGVGGSSPSPVALPAEASAENPWVPSPAGCLSLVPSPLAPTLLLPGLAVSRLRHHHGYACACSQLQNQQESGQGEGGWAH